ncbi:PDR/VanB family oxidoreductase [Rhodococcus koreensis]
MLDCGLVRQYSLSSDPADRTRWRIGVLREPRSRGGSEYVHTKIEVGSTVRVSTPRNNFPLRPADSYLFIAGGIGITPVLPMISRAHAVGADWSLLYGGRSRTSMAFLDELAVYGDRVTAVPEDESGLLDLAGTLGKPRPGTQVYACGPEPLLHAVEANMSHWPMDSLHLERFAPKTASANSEDHEFIVEFVNSDTTASVPVGRSILAVAEDLDLPVFSSCEEGTCSTCSTVLLGGEADHRDSVLSEAEQARNDTILICVSRAKKGCTKLRLEL